MDNANVVNKNRGKQKSKIGFKGSKFTSKGPEGEKRQQITSMMVSKKFQNPVGIKIMMIEKVLT